MLTNSCVPLHRIFVIFLKLKHIKTFIPHSLPPKTSWRQSDLSFYTCNTKNKEKLEAKNKDRKRAIHKTLPEMGIDGEAMIFRWESYSIYYICRSKPLWKIIVLSILLRYHLLCESSMLLSPSLTGGLVQCAWLPLCLKTKNSNKICQVFFKANLSDYL